MITKEDLIRCREYYYGLKKEQEQEKKKNERLDSIVKSAKRYKVLRKEHRLEPEYEKNLNDEDRLARIKGYTKAVSIIDNIRNNK